MWDVPWWAWSILLVVGAVALGIGLLVMYAPQALGCT